MSATAISPDEVQHLQKENAGLRDEITTLRASIAYLKKKLFGGGQSETLDRAQLLLELGKLEQLVAVPASSVTTVTYERPTGPAPK